MKWLYYFLPPYPYPHGNVHLLTETQSVNYSTLRPLSHRNKIGDKFGDPTTVTVGDWSVGGWGEQI